METFFRKIVGLATRVATSAHLLVPSDVKFLGLKVPDDGAGGETDAMDAEAAVSGAT